MKSVLRSAKPYWIYLILTGKKTVEVGKDLPKSKDWNKVVAMYCSKDMRSFNRIPEKDREWMRKYLGKVACRFVCDKLEQFTVGSLGCDDIQTMACLSYKEMIDYFYKPEELNGNTVKFGYGWHISQLKIYDTPKELGEFKKERINCYEYPCQCCKFYHKDKEGLFDCDNIITRPPQSWCYVQEIE